MSGFLVVHVLLFYSQEPPNLNFDCPLTSSGRNFHLSCNVKPPPPKCKKYAGDIFSISELREQSLLNFIVISISSCKLCVSCLFFHHWACKSSSPKSTWNSLLQIYFSPRSLKLQLTKLASFAMTRVGDQGVPIQATFSLLAPKSSCAQTWCCSTLDFHTSSSPLLKQTCPQGWIRCFWRMVGTPHKHFSLLLPPQSSISCLWWTETQASPRMGRVEEDNLHFCLSNTINEDVGPRWWADVFRS